MVARQFRVLEAASSSPATSTKKQRGEFTPLFVFSSNCTANGQFAKQIALLRLLIIPNPQTLAQKEFACPAIAFCYPSYFACGDLLEVCARFFGRSAGHGESFQSKSPRDSIAPLCHSGGNGVTDRISKGTQGQLQNDTLRCPWRRNRISADIHTDDARNLCHLSNHASREVIPYGITSKDLARSTNFDLSVC